MVAARVQEPLDVVPMLVALAFLLVAAGGFYVFATRMDRSHQVARLFTFLRRRPDENMVPSGND